MPRQDRKITSYDVLMGSAEIGAAVHPTKIPGLSIVPSTVDLSGAELELVGQPRRNFRLKDTIVRYNEHGSEFSYVLIDCPPSLSLLTVNAMTAADAVVVPLQCEFFALEGLSQLLQTVERIRGRFNPGLSIMGVALTMYDRRNRLTDQVADDVRACLGDLVFSTVIPRNVRLAEAPSYGLPGGVFDPSSRGAQAYLSFAQEMVERIPTLRG